MIVALRLAICESILLVKEAAAPVEAGALCEAGVDVEVLDGKAAAIFEATCFGTVDLAGAADLATSLALGVGFGLVVVFGAGVFAGAFVGVFDGVFVGVFVGVFAGVPDLSGCHAQPV